MRRANEYTDAGGDPIEAVRRWVSPELLMREADMSRLARHGDASGPDGPDLHTQSLGTAAYFYGFATARLFLDPDASLDPDAASASSEESVLSALGSTVALISARDSLRGRMREARGFEAMNAMISRDIDPSALHYAARQASFQMNGIDTAGDLQQVIRNPGGPERIAEVLAMFFDGFLLALHLPG
ncbi:hypothetical protein ASF47_19145 [Nocardioides sp. Leaf285]|nr:hypothetical protein ASF47_19145 [Nocardioides sp. Leaf285]